MGIQTSFISVGAVGVTVVSSGVSAAVALPVTQNGSAPKYIRVQCDNLAYIKLGSAGVVATNNDILISANMPEYIATGGFTHIAYLQQTAGARVNVTPLEG